MEFLNMKEMKRYSFEEIKEKNKKNEENKSLNMDKSKINREFVRINDLKNKENNDNDNKLIPSFDEDIFINELVNICQKHSKDNIMK